MLSKSNQQHYSLLFPVMLSNYWFFYLGVGIFKIRLNDNDKRCCDTSMCASFSVHFVQNLPFKKIVSDCADFDIV